MLKNRARDPRSAVPSTPILSMRPTSRPPMARPEPDYEVVEFPTEQYVNAKLQPPPPPPPRPPTGHPPDAGSSCGLCGGGHARVRCTECGRRALCASCDDMYHRHPKRRNHQRQALSHLQLRDERPPLPPKAAPPVPPPRRHKISGDRSTASPIPSPSALDHRRATLSLTTGAHKPISTITNTNHFAAQRQFHNPHQPVQTMGAHMGSMPYLPGHHQTNTPNMTQDQTHMAHFVSPGRPRGAFPGYNVPNIIQPPQMVPWDAQENISNSWGRPLRRGTSVMELGGVAPAPTGCSGCAHCAGNPWRYGSCANLDHSWAQGAWPQTYCGLHPSNHNPQMVHHHGQPLQTPQSYRRAESRMATVSRAASRAGSRAVSPVCSIRSRASRRSKHRSPSPIALPSSDADSESENESDHQQSQNKEKDDENSLGPAPPPATATWQCEHCTFVNEPGVRVCTVCCRTPTTKPKIITTEVINNGLSKLKIDKSSPSPSKNLVAEPCAKKDNRGNKSRYSTERTSTGCGPSPPRDYRAVPKSINRLVTPTRENSNNNIEQLNSIKQVRHDIAVGTSPPKELNKQQVLPLNENRSLVNSPSDARPSLKRETPTIEKKNSHSISVGPSPPKEYLKSNSTSQKKSNGNSPQRDNSDTRPVSRSSRATTGTSPPPQSISTQTYEVPTNWEREQSITRSRPRRRFRDESQRERSHSRLSLSSDTRESERSVRTSGGRWEWREPRDSSPSGGGDWSGSERRQNKTRLIRRASHLDLRRGKPSRRSSAYGSEIPSPETISNNRAISLEALAGAGSRREAEKGLELARLMSEAERLGFSAAEVHAALAQNPAAPLAWLRERWPSLCAGVRAAAARLAPGVNVTELEARASLAKHRGAMWPAVNDCVERFRRQAESGVGEERRLRGHVWGPPIGADDDAAPQQNTSSRIHRLRADDSSDEFEATINTFQDDDWMYLPLQNNPETSYEIESPKRKEPSHATNDIAEKLKALLKEAGIPLIDDTLLLNGLLANNSIKPVDAQKKPPEQVMPNQTDFIPIENSIVTPVLKKPHSTDFIQSENDFIDAYNALTRLSPLPNVNDTKTISKNTEDLNFGEKKMTNENSHVNEPSNDSLKKESNDSIKSNNYIVNEKVASEHVGDNIGNITNNNYRLPNQERNKKLDLDENEDNNQAISEIDSKQNNLSDIVDNTQKLIQQMKKEISLDIHLGQDKSDSESESNSSSDELTNEEQSSDKESSYSDTENDSEELSSDEKEMYNNKRENLNEQSKQRISDNRTSSEDNEHFEEAMDHVENEIENFKQTNIEMLNSIARSLHEEHTFSVGVNDVNENNRRNQDVNNNLFSAVNTFEEIYAQLDNNNKHVLTEKQNKIEKFYNSPKVITEKPKYKTYIKHNMESLSFMPQFPIKLEYVENKHQSLKALIEDLPETIENINDITKDNHDSFIPITEATNTITLTETIVNTNNIDNTVEENPSQLIERVAEESSNFIENETFHVSGSRNDNENNMLNTEDRIEKNKENVIQVINFDNTSPGLATSQENKTLKTPNVTNKSNIPKLIKTIQTSKQKPDKNYPKVIASKVPVRRGSLKHYPAPNPPKNHFGNVLLGNVKQLQTRLFHNKTSKINLPKPLVSDEASTSSTIIKKKPAPAPPPSNQDKQYLAPENIISNKKKNTYFRETCRTEDEWTESDVDEPAKIITSTIEADEDQISISQPQPITMRQVSGQLIDLTQIRLPEGSPERQARMLLAEGATETWEQAQLAVKLVLQGTETPSALLAALECTDFPSALAYLNQDCELCASKYPEHEMVSMLRCTHRCCRECARYYFTVQITERSIADCVCPFCKEPELENLPEDAWLDYFANMDILLKTLLETDTHELFQRKLRDRTLARDPNFKWCIECSSGFFVHPKQKRLKCPECKSITCANCRKPWNSNHEGITCEQYSTWLEDNDPERSIAAVQQHLRENGLECPRCHFKYSLSRGGCMHFTCTQCKYEFCYGCGKTFTMGARCGLSEYCAKLGLHAHHPRNCLFYLRDKEPHELQTLLQMNNVTYEIETSETNSGRCPIQLQRETPGGLVDAICGNEVQVKNAGLCKMHYVEYLAGLARALDPIPIMDVSELVAELRRRALSLPERGPWDTDPIYAGMCAEIVREKIPLD